MKKDASASSSSSATAVNKNDTPESANMNIKEDNYVKLVLSKRLTSIDDEEDDECDDEFDDSDTEMEKNDDEDDDDDDESVGSAASKNSLYDTAKNRHFLVWRTRSSVRKSVSHDSDSELSEDSDDSDQEIVKPGNNEDEEEEADEHGHAHDHEEDVELFLSEVHELLQEAIKTNMDPSNLILEINGRKHANNIQIDDLNFYLAKAILNLPVSGKSLF